MPPDTTQTTGPSSAGGSASAHATGVAPAPSATTRARSTSSRTAAPTSSTVDTREPMPNSFAWANIPGNTAGPPIPSTKDGVAVTVVGASTASEAANGAAVATSAA